MKITKKRETQIGGIFRAIAVTVEDPAIHVEHQAAADSLRRMVDEMLGRFDPDEMDEMEPDPEPASVKVKLTDGVYRCCCNVGQPCPLGRMGMEERCTEAELNRAGVDTEREPEKLSEIPTLQDEPAWLTRFAAGDVSLSEHAARYIAAYVRRLRYEANEVVEIMGYTGPEIRRLDEAIRGNPPENHPKG